MSLTKPADDDEEQSQIEAHIRPTLNVEKIQIVHAGKFLAVVNRRPLRAHREYHLHIAAGSDPVLVLAMTTIIDHECVSYNRFVSSLGPPMASGWAITSLVSIVTGAIIGRKNTAAELAKELQDQEHHEAH